MLSLLILLTAGLAKKGPALMRNQFEAEIIDQREGDDEDDEDDLPKDRVSQEDLLKKLTAGERKYQTRSARHRFYLRFIKKYETSLSINPRFLNKSYPYKRDPEFWIAQIKKPVSVQLNNRVMETEMLNQVKQANHNSLDKWLGIGFTRQSNIFTLERDFLSQNYSLGVIGVLLLLVPYLGVLLYTALSWLLKAQNRTLEITALIAAQTFILAAAYMSGNVLDSLTATFILAFIDGFTLLQLKQARM